MSKRASTSKELELEKEATGKIEQVENVDWEEVTSTKKQKIETTAKKLMIKIRNWPRSLDLVK